MFSKFLLLLFLLRIAVAAMGQDSIYQEILPDSLISGDEAEPVDYMAEGYFDKIPYFDQVSDVDSTLFFKLSDRYKTEEFDYENENLEQIGFFEKIFDRIGRWLNNLFPDTQYFKFADVVYDIIALMALLLLVWIIYKVVFSGKRLLGPNEQNETAQEEFRFVEKNLLDVDLLGYIEEAKRQDDFGKAIRYLNLLNTQLLARKGYIKWRYTKSNVELIEEIDDREMRLEFTRNVNVFNRVWYGNEPIDRVKYEELARYFLDFQTKWR